MKNNKALKKVLDNLSSDKPDISYIKGVLETLYEEEIATIQTSPAHVLNPFEVPLVPPNVNLQGIQQPEFIQNS